MSANTFGERFKITSFGESHGPALGIVIDGCPAGLMVDENLLRKNLDRRRPGQSTVTTQRSETDSYEILSGVFEGKTLGTPITVIVRNQDQKSSDYDYIKTNPRPGHADDTWKNKFQHADHRGGGRTSGRETVTRVLAGSFAQMLCHKLAPQMQVLSFSKQIGNFTLTNEEISAATYSKTESNVVRFPGSEASKIENMLNTAREAGESYGGIVHCKVTGAPDSLGQPVFHKLKADLTAAMMTIGATTGVGLGRSLNDVSLPGTKFHQDIKDVYGGIRGGISTGEDIQLDVYFKPTSSILDTAKKGRHDPCILPRAVPVVEAMAYIVLADHLLWRRTDVI